MAAGAAQSPPTGDTWMLSAIVAAGAALVVLFLLMRGRFRRQ